MSESPIEAENADASQHDNDDVRAKKSGFNIGGFMAVLMEEADRVSAAEKALKSLTADEAMEQAILNWRMAQEMLKDVRRAAASISEDLEAGMQPDPEIFPIMDIMHSMTISGINGYQMQTQLALKLHDRLVAADSALA